MRKKIFCTLLSVSFILISYMNSTAAQKNDKKKYPDTVHIDVIAEMKPEGVTLDHKKHIKEYKISCNECHHMYDEANKKGPKPCVECHDLTETKVIKGIRARLIKTSLMKNVYHDSCKSCHEKLKRKGKPFPKKCSVCHPYDFKK